MGVFGRIPDNGRLFSDLDGGLSCRYADCLPGVFDALMAGSERFCLRSWALVVVGSVRSEVVEVRVPISLLRGGGGGSPRDGEVVVGVGILAMDD